MKIYMNFAVDSGIDAYDYGKDWVRVQFKDGEVYEYTNAGTAENIIEGMKTRALLGKDLQAFIDAHAQSLCSRRVG
ncbi:MAG: hypothetical protein HGB01_03205 [Chlorobiaceae bacterium]|nr:hypothetical protein [Chlorobiaceae bacterium]NTV25204.1 hypothetical protein [Chlorobiaceae bacterium]